MGWTIPSKPMLSFLPFLFGSQFRWAKKIANIDVSLFWITMPNVLDLGIPKHHCFPNSQCEEAHYLWEAEAEEAEECARGWRIWIVYRLYAEPRLWQGQICQWAANVCDTTHFYAIRDRFLTGVQKNFVVQNCFFVGLPHLFQSTSWSLSHFMRSHPHTENN